VVYLCVSARSGSVWHDKFGAYEAAPLGRRRLDRWEVKLRARIARRPAAPEASAKTGALRRGVSKAGDATRAVPTRTLEKRPQGPNTAGAVAWDPVVCRRGTGPCASAWRKLRSVVCREAHTAAQGAPKLARKLVISGIQRAVDAFTTGSITLH